MKKTISCFILLSSIIFLVNCTKKDNSSDDIQPTPIPSEGTIVTINKNGKPFGELFRNKDNQIVEATWYNIVTTYYPLPGNLAEQVYYYAKKYTFEYNQAGKKIKQLYYIIPSKGEEGKWQYTLAYEYDNQNRLQKTYMLDKNSSYPGSSCVSIYNYNYDTPLQINLTFECASNFSGVIYMSANQVSKEEIFLYKNEPGIQRRYVFTYEYDAAQSAAWSSMWVGSDLYRDAFEMNNSFCKKMRLQDHVGLDVNEKILYDNTYQYNVEKYTAEEYPEIFTVTSSSGKDIYTFTYQTK